MAEKRIYSGARCYTFSEAMIELVTGGESRNQSEDELVRQFTELYGFVDYGSRKDFLKVYRTYWDRATGKSEQDIMNLNDAEVTDELPRHLAVCERCPESGTTEFSCEYQQRFQAGRYLQIRFKEIASQPKKDCQKCAECHPQKQGMSSVKFHDVRLKGYPTVVEVQRTEYISGTRRGIRCNMPPINGLQRTNHDKTTNRLIAAMVRQNLSCHMPRLIAEGYGISLSTVIGYSEKESKQIEKRKANLRLQQNADAIVMGYTAFTVRGKTYNAYVQKCVGKSELVGLYTNREIAYFKSLCNGNTYPEQQVDGRAIPPERVQALAYDHAALWSSRVKAPPAIYALTIMICDVLVRHEYFCEMEDEMRVGVQLLLHEVTESECTVSQLRYLADELCQYPPLYVAAERLRAHLEEMIYLQRGISQTQIGHLTSKIEFAMMSREKFKQTRERPEEIPDMFEVANQLQGYMRKSDCDFDEMRMRMLFFNESVVPFQIVSRNSIDTDACIPALRDAICFDELKIKSVGIKWPCLMHLLETGLLDRERMGLQPCKAARMSQRCQSYGGRWRTLWESGQFSSGIFEDCPNECPELEEDISQL